MKYKSLFFMIICFFLFSISAYSQAYKQYDINLSAGYGIGNVFKKFLKDAITFPAEYTVKSTGPFCLQIDYGIFKKISAGIAIGYSVTKGQTDFQGFNFSERLNSLSVLVRSNYHIGKMEKFDPYAGFGLGYLHFKYSNDQNIEKRNSVPGNFGYSLQLGGRYYLTPSVSIYGELGYIGSSLGQAGISYKL